MFDNAALEWDDAFAEHGGHSLLIAVLTLRLQVAGWKVTVRDLLTDRNTARRVAALPRELRQASEPPASTPLPVCLDQSGERDEAAARVLSVRRFTTLQALFLLLLYAPALVTFLGLVAMEGVGELFLSAQLREFLWVGALMYALALVLPFANLLWVAAIRLLLGRDFGGGAVRPGVYPKWSRAHLRIWCGERRAQSVLGPLRTILRSGPAFAWVLRRLGARVGDNLQCAHDAEFSGPLGLLAIEDDVAIQTGAYVAMSRWVGQELHVGPVRLESGCKIGMRAGVADHVTVGRGSWITPLTPVLGDVGPGEIWEGAPARCAGRCIELERTMRSCRPASPVWLLEGLNVLLQVVLELALLVLPTAAVSWWATTFLFVGSAERTSDYFAAAPRLEIVWHIGLYAFVTTWVTIVLVSVLGCLFVRWTSASPGLVPTRGLRAALLLYRVKKLNQIQRLWTWTITGQYLRALAGVGFSRVGGSESDLMINLVPEAASADAQVFWSHGCFTNVLDLGARHLTLRQLDMPANFFAGNNCVAESGQLPSNFLLGVSTPGSDIRFRRQMRSRLGVPMTVAGNPPVRFGSADVEVGDGTGTGTGELPSFRHFLGRVALNDLVGIGLLPIAEALAFAVFYTLLLPSFGHPVVSALAALILGECSLVGAAVLVKKLLVGSRWGTDDSTSFWSWRHFTYFFAQDCFFVWCRQIDGNPRRNRALECHSAADGLPDREANSPPRTAPGLRLERRELRRRLRRRRPPAAPHLREDDAAREADRSPERQRAQLRIHRHGRRRSRARDDSPAADPRPERDVPADGHLPGQSRGTGGRRFGSRCPRCRSRAPSPIAPRTLEAPRVRACPLRSRRARQAQRLPPEIGQGAPEPLHRAEAEASAPPAAPDDLHGEEDHRPAGHRGRSEPEGLAEAVAVEERREHQGLGQVDGQRQAADRGERRENGPAARSLRARSRAAP